MTNTSTATVDAIVVGAGLAGLLTAYRLQQKGKSVLVLEGRDRLGGRMYGKEVGPEKAYVDLGGQWLGPTQYLMLDLIKELGIEKFDYMSGVTRLTYKEKQTDYKGDMYFAMMPPGKAGEDPTGVATAEEIADAKQAGDRIMEIVAGFKDGELPFTHPDAELLDSQTMTSWLQANTTTDFAKFFFTVTCSTLGPLGPSHPSTVSVLHFAYLFKNSPQSEVPENFLIHGGAGQIPPKLADKIGRDKVLVNQDVVKVKYDSEKQEVFAYTRQGQVFSGRSIVMACPPAVASAVLFDPPLSAQRHQLMQRFPMGTIAKILVAYDQKYWYDDKNIVMCIDTSPEQYVEFTGDASDPTKKTGIIAAFIQGQKYFAWKKLSQEKQLEVVLDDLVRMYKIPELKSPIAVEIGDWPKDQFAGGGYSGSVGPGVWTQYGEGLLNNEWDGRVRFCGTEYSMKWAGFFEGAAQTAEETAKRIVEKLDG
ncbi:monoamine oxidase [Nitzschia inconspicua]|uniref:monoamine oxidase n=1 Tax=Nitzschia inconspicua TaxID=303405 RepID=A0A9K3KVD8_9STRA|nr:monoamine oxidase [Nitzschia inconspicua]KAG7349905.1 monoamine oxidase [Nitzschia inconspicua]